MYQNGQVVLFNSCRFWRPWQDNFTIEQNKKSCIHDGVEDVPCRVTVAERVMRDSPLRGYTPCHWETDKGRVCSKTPGAPKRSTKITGNRVDDDVTLIENQDHAETVQFDKNKKSYAAHSRGRCLASRSAHRQRTRPHRSRQRQRRCKRCQRSRQHRRHPVSMTSPLRALSTFFERGTTSIAEALADPAAERTVPGRSRLWLSPAKTALFRLPGKLGQGLQ
jgi:hypothetical protein